MCTCLPKMRRVHLTKLLHTFHLTSRQDIEKVLVGSFVQKQDLSISFEMFISMSDATLISSLPRYLHQNRSTTTGNIISDCTFCNGGSRFFILGVRLQQQQNSHILRTFTYCRHQNYHCSSELLAYKKGIIPVYLQAFQIKL